MATASDAEAFDLGLRGPNHCGLATQCGICADAIFGREQVVALYGNDDSTAYAGHSRPFPFPAPGQRGVKPVQGFEACHIPNCYVCWLSTEFVCVHHDCWAVFMRSYSLTSSDALDRLWTVAAWRVPWRGSLPMPELWRPAVPDMDLLRKTTAAAAAAQHGGGGFPPLARLPAELVEMIQAHSQHALFWRCYAALRLAARLSERAPEPLVALPLCEVLSWERHGTLERADPRSRPPVVRLTIDMDGVRTVERLAQRPPLSVAATEHSNHLAYIVEEEVALASIVANIKDGLLRLEKPSHRTVPPIWNTPTPPNRSTCRPVLDAPFWQRVMAVEASKIHGLTFLLDGRNLLYGFHVHGCGGGPFSSALEVFRAVDVSLQQHLLWIYVPVAAADRLVGFDVRSWGHGPAVEARVRLRLAGDVPVGQRVVPRTAAGMADAAAAWEDGTAQQQQQRPPPPTALLYCLPRGGEYTVPYVGTYSEEEERQSEAGETEEVWPPPPPPPPLTAPVPATAPAPRPRSPADLLAHQAYYAWAPLAGIAAATVFSDRLGFCEGILLEYDSGAARAVGQCRRAADREPAAWFAYRGDRCERPVLLIFRVEPRQVPGAGGLTAGTQTHVRFVSAADVDQHGDPPPPPGWMRVPLLGVGAGTGVGTLRFWFTRRWTRMDVQV